MSKYQKILVIVGPTSSGKSALGVALARKFHGEVISADSRQVYRGLNIGTGKITKKEMEGVPHHLLDVASPKRTFTAHEYTLHAFRAIAQNACRGRLPILTGGTGFYIDALMGRVTLPNVATNKKLRAQLEKKSAAELFAMLKKRDPRRAKTIDPHNTRRLIRALEIGAALGKVPHSTEGTTRYDALWIGITMPREVLRKKIHARLLTRMKAGMVAEARRLHAAGFSYKRMESFGLEYRALAQFLQGKISRAEMLVQLERDIWHYAKRQLTYWKRNEHIRWFEPSEQKNIEKALRLWLKK